MKTEVSASENVWSGEVVCKPHDGMKVHLDKIFCLAVLFYCFESIGEGFYFFTCLRTR